MQVRVALDCKQVCPCRLTVQYSTRCTVQDGIVHDVQYTVYSNVTRCTVQDGIVHDAQYGTVQYTMYSTRCTVTLHAVQCTMYNVQCTITMYTNDVQYTMNDVYMLVEGE
jgi:hypothetical protein